MHKMNTAAKERDRGGGGSSAAVHAQQESIEKEGRKKTPEERRRAFIRAAGRGFQSSLATLVSSFPRFPTANTSATAQGRPRLRRWGFSFSRWSLRFLRLYDQQETGEGKDTTSPAPPPPPAKPEAGNALQDTENRKNLLQQEEDEQLHREVDTEERRERAVLLANLLVALVCLSAILLPIQLYTQGWCLNTWCPIVSMSVHSSLLLLARWRCDQGRLSSWLACLYLNALLVFRSAWYGVHAEIFAWVPIIPIIVFGLLGRRAGVAATVALIFQCWFLYLYAPQGHAFALGCVETNHAEGLVFVPLECDPLNRQGGYIGRFGTEELVASKVLFITFLGVFAYIYDSTRSSALRRMKEALQQKEKVNASLQQATNAKTAFLANMSHELRTPMHGIIAMAKDLMEMPLSESARESAKIVSDCADHLLGLVNDILDFARIESNQLELEAIPLSVVDEVEKAVSLQAAMAKKKRVTLTTHIDVGEALRVGDPLRFRQILINLLSNAIKFTPEDGRVAVSAFVSPTQPEFISVSVDDSGIGIPARGLDHIFKSFSQLDASVGRKFGGSGLGLAISRKLCHAMEGDIRVTSQVGLGSVFTFTVRLPLASAPATPSDCLRTADARAAENAAALEALRGVRVLVVEDNPINQKVATKMLASLGCRVTVAGDGVEAVAKFEKEAFDVILMDVQMPVMDGFQATALIRALEHQRAAAAAASTIYCAEDGGGDKQVETEEVIIKGMEAEEEEDNEDGGTTMAMKKKARRRRVPIVALTASATRDYEAECLEKGMDRFLTKPFRRETLQATLVDILSASTSDADDYNEPGEQYKTCASGQHQ